MKDAEPVPEKSKSEWKSEIPVGWEQNDLLQERRSPAVKPRGDKGNVGEIEDLSSVR